jgi:hypothetical protein
VPRASKHRASAFPMARIPARARRKIASPQRHGASIPEGNHPQERAAPVSPGGAKFVRQTGIVARSNSISRHADAQLTAQTAAAGCLWRGKAYACPAGDHRDCVSRNIDGLRRRSPGTDGLRRPARPAGASRPARPTRWNSHSSCKLRRDNLLRAMWPGRDAVNRLLWRQTQRRPHNNRPHRNLLHSSAGQ